MPSATRPNGCEAAITCTLGMTRAFTPPRKSPTPQVRLALSASSAAPKLVGHRPRSRDSVELVRVVEDGSLSGAGGADVVMAGDCVQQLGGGVQPFEQPKPEVNVAEQPSLVGRGEDRRPAKLARTTDIVDERRG